MKETGQLLKKARESQNLSVREVSLTTKVNTKNIEAIECGDVASLPAKTFLRGFVRSYAQHLKLDVDEVLKVFHKEMGSTLPEPSENPISESAQWPEVKVDFLKEKALNTRTLVTAATIILLILLIVGAKNIFDKYQKESQVSQPPENLVSLPADTSNKFSKDAKQDKPNEETKVAQTQNENLSDENSIPAPSENSPEKILKEQTLTEDSSPKVPAQDREGEEEKNKPQAEQRQEENQNLAENSNQSAELQKPIQPKARPQEIILEALDRVKVRVKVDDGDVKAMTLKPDQVHTIRAKRTVMIDLSDGGVVNIIQNGRDRGVPGNLGSPKKIQFP